METTERIVEAYVRYVKGWATIPNIRCEGQFEVDLLAIDPATLQRYHVETGVHIGSGFSKLTSQPFDADKLKERVQAPKMRRTIGFYLKRKFGPPEVLKVLSDYGFEDGNYQRVIVSWGWTEGAKVQADRHGVMLLDFRYILHEITRKCRGNTAYLMDDTLRTLHLLSLAAKHDQGTVHLEGTEQDG